MKKKNIQKVNNNAGFSLVELLIAVIILAIIVVPMLHGFVTSARMNGKARVSQRATTVAQDIMEGLKAYDIEELKEQFGDPMNGFYVIESKLIKGSIEEDKDREQNDPAYRGDPDSPGVYYFALEGVQIQGSEFDALIRIDARNYEPGRLKADGNAEGHDNAFNDIYMASPGSVVKGKDGSYPHQSNTVLIAANKDNLGFLEAVQENPDISSDIDDIKELTLKELKDEGVEKIKRTITLNIRPGTADDEGKPTMNMDIVYRYTYEYNNVEYFYVPPGHEPGKGYPCGSNISSGGNFYLMYYPLYDAEQYDDKIIINNEAHQPVRIYIVKQAEQDTESLFYLSDSQLNLAENNYRAVVNIIDTEGNAQNVKIRTNLGMNLVNASFLSSPSAPTEGKLPTYELEKVDILPQARYEVNGSTNPDINVFGLSGMRLDLTSIGLTGTGNDDDITEVIFDVEVGVYQKGAKDDGFPPEQRMAYITGSKNN